VRSRAPHVVSIEEPVQPLTAQGHSVVVEADRPVKLVALEPLVPDHEAVLFPEQNLELRFAAVDEDEELTRERIELA
jgi:hypothetical protein